MERWAVSLNLTRANPEEILTRQAMAEHHTTVISGTQRQESQIHALSNALKQQLIKELREDRT